MKTALEFLREEIYLPGFMTLQQVDYDGTTMTFDFHPTEPHVTKIHLGYFTPRGLHITLSQAGYCLAEKTTEEQGIIERGDLRDRIQGGRLKIVELNQRFRKEVRLQDTLQGRLELRRVRGGKSPVIHLGFDFANRAIIGELIGIIAPKQLPQTNQELLRN